MSEIQFHRLLKRQLNKFFPNYAAQPQLQDFLEAVNNAYKGSDEEYANLERILELSSQEQFKLNQELKKFSSNLEEIVKERTEELLQTNNALQSEVEVRKLAEEKLQFYTEDLEKRNKELDKFAYIVSHDLKSPLKAIKGLALLMQEDLEENITDDLTYKIELILETSEKMSNLISGILLYSKAGRISGEKEEFNSFDLVSDIVKSFKLVESFKINISKHLPRLKTYKIAIEQIFTNYISNAIKYTNLGAPEISINYFQTDTHHVFGVTDNGEGIDPKHHESIFDLFQMLSTKKVSDSTGIGLSIVNKLAHELGGKAWVESNVGSGSTFYFSLMK